MFNDILSIINSIDLTSDEQVNRIGLILDNNTDLVNTRDNQGSTLLHHAARGNVKTAANTM